MNIPTPPADAEMPLPMNSDVEVEISKLVEQQIPKRNAFENAERLRTSLTRLTSGSINNLEGLASELQNLQEFLKSEVGRIQGEIESVLAGVKIIIETIAPWNSAGDSPVPPPKGGRGVHAATTANTTSAPLPNLKTSP